MVFFPRGVQSVHPDVVIGCVRCWCCKKNIYDGLCTVLSAKDEFLNFIDIICSLENSLGICIYTIYSDDNSWYGLWWFVFPESAKHEFAFSIIAWKIHLVPVYSDMVCDGLCTVLMPEPAKEELVSPLPFCPWHSSAGQTYIHP